MSEAVENTSSDTEVTALRRLEIESLLRSSREAIYQRSVTAPRKVQGSFAKTPLIELARQAEQRDSKQEASKPPVAEDETASLPQASDAGQATEGETDVSSAAVAGEAETEATDGDLVDDVAAAAASFESDIGEASPPTADKLETEEATVELPPELDEQAIDATVDEPQVPVAPDQEASSIAPDMAGADASYERGFAEGQAAAQAALAEVADRFATLMNVLSADNAIASEALETELRQAVLHIAAERAGMAISDLPEQFAVKIRRLTQMVDQAGKSLTISLNAEDLVAIRPYLEQATPPLTAQLVADEKKLRGDVEIHAGAISVRDMLIERGEVADEDKFIEIGRVMRDLISESDDAETPPDAIDPEPITDPSATETDDTDTDQ